MIKTNRKKLLTAFFLIETEFEEQKKRTRKNHEEAYNKEITEKDQSIMNGEIKTRIER